MKHFNFNIRSHEVVVIIVAIQIFDNFATISSKQSRSDMNDIVSGSKTHQQPTEEDPETSGVKEDEGRPPLPPGNIFRNPQAKLLKCGKSYDIAKNGHKFFMMDSKRSCYHSFLGSRTANCRVGILCDGKIELDKPSDIDTGCDREYLKITDGTEGLTIGCGRFSFKKAPRFAKNNGTDLYVYYKGTSPNPCVALCIEDINNDNDMKSPKHIGPNKFFEGLPLEPDCHCGKRLDFGRIVGGNNAMKNEFPWIGAIVFAGEPKYARMPFCGGALVNDRYFISAAHCFVPDEIEAEEIQVLLHAHVMDQRYKKGLSARDARLKNVPGWNLPKETDESEDTIRVDIEEIITHPLFDSNNYDWDIAILKFKQRINFETSIVKPICLPLISELFNYEDDELHVVAGWGKPSEKSPVGSRILQKLEVPYANRSICMNSTVPTFRHLCAGYLEGNKDACAGDSGGPLMYKFKSFTNQYILSGVVSAGEGCARQGKLGLYTNTLEVVQWIYHHTADGIWCSR